MANAKRRKLLRQQSRAQKPKTTPSKPQTPKKQAPQKRHQNHTQQQHQEAVIPFSPNDKILLIGEGDLSFAASIIQHHRCVDVTATVLEKDHAELVGKYPSVDANIAVITDGRRKTDDAQDTMKDDVEGAHDSSVSQASEHDSPIDQDDAALTDSSSSSPPSPPSPPSPSSPKRDHKHKLLYNVDATKLPSSLTRPIHTAILFNFPHVGGKSTDVNRQVRHNQQLLVSFFRSAQRALAPGGSIVVTLFEGEPYTLWNIRDLGRHSNLQVERSFRFQSAAYPGYRHARTLGVVRNKKGEEGGGWKGEERSARTFVFRRKGEVGEQKQAKRKRKRDVDSDED